MKPTGRSLTCEVSASAERNFTSSSGRWAAGLPSLRRGGGATGEEAGAHGVGGATGRGQGHREGGGATGEEARQRCHAPKALIQTAEETVLILARLPRPPGPPASLSFQELRTTRPHNSKELCQPGHFKDADVSLGATVTPATCTEQMLHPERAALDKEKLVVQTGAGNWGKPPGQGQGLAAGKLVRRQNPPATLVFWTQSQ